MPDGSTRARIVEAADRLFYRNGYESTSFADIADVVNISRGNFYYYFKTKDEILDSVIGLRLADSGDMIARWSDEAPTPAGRIKKFIEILVANQSDILLYGCPLGTLSTELGKLGHAAQADAAALFTLFRSWLVKQFAALDPDADADALAMQVLAWSQGVATLASAFRDKDYIDREVEKMCAWVDDLARESNPNDP